jgi:hypothetical protein
MRLASPTFSPAMGAYSRPSAQASMKSNASSPVSEQQRSGGTLVTDVTALFTAGLHLLYGSVPKQAIEKNVTEVLDRAPITQIVESKTQQLKDFVESPLFGAVDLRTQAQQNADANALMIAYWPSQPQVASANSKQANKAIEKLKSQYNLFDRGRALAGDEGVIKQIALDVVNNDLVEQAKGALNKLAKTNPGLAEKGRQALKAAQSPQPTASASLQTVPSQDWGGQNIQDAATAARNYLERTPTGRYAEEAQRILDRYNELGYFLANGTPEEKSIADILTQELSLFQGTVPITKDVGIYYSTIVPGESIIGMTDAQRYTGLIDFNQGVGANVTPKTLAIFEQRVNPTTP